MAMPKPEKVLGTHDANMCAHTETIYAWEISVNNLFFLKKKNFSPIAWIKQIGQSHSYMN